MFNSIKNMFSKEGREKSKKVSEELMKNFTEKLDIETAEHKKMLDKSLVIENTKNLKAIESNNENELNKIIQEFYTNVELLFNQAIDDINTLFSHKEIFITGFKSQCNSLKKRMEIYGEVPDEVMIKIDEKVKLLENVIEN